MEEKELSQLLVPDLITERTAFQWNAEPQDEWAGWDADYLILLTQTIALQLGYTNEQAEKLLIVFADHLKVQGRAFLAGTIPQFSPAGYVEKCGIVINRSQELALSQSKKQEAKDRYKIEKKQENVEYLVCKLVDPREWIIWVLAEELMHAKLYMMARTQQRDAGIARRFKEIIRKKRGKLSNIDYENCYQEVTVGRMCLRVLSKLVPARRPYYEKLYQESLKTGKRPFPYVRHIAEKTFVSTGFRG